MGCLYHADHVGSLLRPQELLDARKNPHLTRDQLEAIEDRHILGVLKRQKDAGQSESQPVLGFIVGGIGLGVVGAGLLWHFLEPTGPERIGALRFIPWAAPGSAGGALGAAF